MQWRMIGRRIPSRSMTILGDLGQATSAWAPDDWADAIEHLGQRVKLERRELTINYRTPAEIMEIASDLLDEVSPNLARPRSVRRAGYPPVEMTVPRDVLVATTVEHVRELRKDMDEGGTICVVAPPAYLEGLRAELGATEGAQVLDAEVAVLDTTRVKGLEFDSVVIADPDAIVSEQGHRALYVAMTRPTQHLTRIYAA
jgi:DNA helicase IV